MLEVQDPTAVTISSLSERLSRLEAELQKVKSSLPEDRLTMVVFSGDMDKVFASLVIANGAVAMGYDVSMFFTFWGLSALKKGKSLRSKDDVLEKAMALMTPGGLGSLNTSRLNFMGVGPVLFRKMMSDKQVVSLPELFASAREAGVRMIGCTMSMDVLGIKETDLVDGIEFGGVATYLGDAMQSKATLFI